MKLLFTLMSMLLFTLVSNAQGFSTKDSLEINAIIEDWNKAWETKYFIIATKWYSDEASLPMLLETSVKKKRGRDTSQGRFHFALCHVREK